MTTTNATFDLHSRTLAAARITKRPSFIPGAVDPDLVRKSRTIAPGNLLLTALSVAFGICAIGNSLYQFSAKYNDAIVTAILYAIPAALVIGIIAAFRIQAAWRRNQLAMREALTTEATAHPAPRTKVSSDVHFLPDHRKPSSETHFRRATFPAMQTAA